MWSSTKTYICVDVLSGALGKMTTCFFTGSDGFFPRFCWDTRGGKLLPSQWPFVALPVMCDPVLFDFICSLSSPLFTWIYWNGHAEKFDVYGKRHLRNTVIISTSADSFSSKWLWTTFLFSQIKHFIRRPRLSFPKQQMGLPARVWYHLLRKKNIIAYCK